MLMNIFSSFDPYWLTLCYKNFMNIAMIPIIVLNMYWLKLNKTTISLVPMKSYITNQLTMTKLKHLKTAMLMMSAMFMLIIFMNILGMMPYMFSITSHIMFTVSIGLPTWMLLIISSSTYSTKSHLAHLLPDGSPMWLSPFLVLIESISTMLRPMTLSFRLAANMTAGHVIMNLILLFSAVYKMKTYFILTLMSMMYTTFELMICMIQAYIFCLLLSLYANDHS